MISKIYGPKQELTYEKVLDCTKNYVLQHIEEFNDDQLRRLPAFDHLPKFPQYFKKKIVEIASRTDQYLVSNDFRMDVMSSLLAMLSFEQFDLKPLSSRQLEILAYCLSEYPFSTFEEHLTLFADPKLQDALFRHQFIAFEYRSIYQYLKEQAQGVDIHDPTAVSKYQKEMATFLEQTDRDQILAKTNYQQQYEEVVDTIMNLK